MNEEYYNGNKSDSSGQTVAIDERGAAGQGSSNEETMSSLSFSSGSTPPQGSDGNAISEATSSASSSSSKALASDNKRKHKPQNDGRKKARIENPDTSSGSDSAQDAHAKQTKEKHASFAIEVLRKDNSSGQKKKKKKKNRGELESSKLSLRGELTTVEGQLEKNPHFTREQAQAEAKREYNRRNAARSRVRNKCLLQEMEETCKNLTKQVEDLTQRNVVLKARTEAFQQQKRQQRNKSTPETVNQQQRNDQQEQQPQQAQQLIAVLLQTLLQQNQPAAQAASGQSQQVQLLQQMLLLQQQQQQQQQKERQAAAALSALQALLSRQNTSSNPNIAGGPTNTSGSVPVATTKVPPAASATMPTATDTNKAALKRESRLAQQGPPNAGTVDASSLLMLLQAHGATHSNHGNPN